MRLLAFVAFLSLVAMPTPPDAAAAPAGKASAVRKRQAAVKPPPHLADTGPVAALTALPNGPGLLVCEPVSKGADAATTRFAAGCGRWLNLVVAGQPELGKTPLWVSVNHALAELKLTDARLGIEDAKRLPGMLGVTHAALGEIDGDGQRCTLRYQVWEVPAGKTVGEPLSVEGTPEAVVAGLPALARRMAAALGVPSHRVPEKVVETVEQVRFLGGLPWSPWSNLPEADARELMRLGGEQKEGTYDLVPGKHTPLASFLSLSYHAAYRRSRPIVLLAKELLAAFPDNTLVLGEVGREGHATFNVNYVNLPNEELRQALRNYPNSAPLRSAECYFQRIARGYEAARQAGRLAVRCNRNNPDTWLLLDDAISDYANGVRHHVFVNELTGGEMEFCQKLYEEETPIVRKATQLDSLYTSAWRRLSGAAAFMGDGGEASRALDRTLALDPTSYGAHWWGLQLYQPKWYPDRAKMERTARHAAEVSAGWSPRERVQVAISGHVALPIELVHAIVRTDEERAAVDEHIRNCTQKHTEREGGENQ